MVDATYQPRRDSRADQTRRALAAVFGAQRTEALAAQQIDRSRWDPQLRAIVLEQNTATAREIAGLVAIELEGDYDPAVMDAWLATNAEIVADGINERTAERLARAADEAQPLLAIGELFTTLATVTAGVYATQMVTTSANFGAHDAAVKSGAGNKTWQTNSGNPRSAHAAMSGQTVPIRDNFSNGMAWPGDPQGGAENNANCACSVVFSGGGS